MAEQDDEKRPVTPDNESTSELEEAPLPVVADEPSDPPEPEEPFSHEHSEPPRSSSVKIKTIRNKYESYCQVCREYIPVGMKVLWSPGRGVAHIHCAESFSQ